MNTPVPPHVSTAVKDSFARYTLENRFPSILEGIAGPRRGTPSAAALDLLKEDLRCGIVTDPFDSSPATPNFSAFDRGLFTSSEIASWIEEIVHYRGRPWTDLPFYFAEAYFYLRILLASGYYDPVSPYFRADPFGPAKEAELARVLSSRDWALYIEGFYSRERDAADRQNPRGFAETCEEAVLFMLKGNRIDLSNAGMAERGRGMIHRREREDLLVDHVDLLVERIARSSRVDIILDNAGSELLADLMFAWFFLRAVPKGSMVLHAKKAPIFVSDALAKDLSAAVGAMAESVPSGPMGSDLRGFLETGRLAVKEHHFWNGPKHFPALPPDLVSDLAGADLVLIKGDANYRRLLEDRTWPLDADMADLTGWFPVPFAVLRTLKCEVAVDIPLKRSDRLFAEDPDWLINGHWGIVRLILAGG